MSARERKRLRARQERLRREAEERSKAADEAERRLAEVDRALDTAQCILLGRAQKQDAANDPRYAAQVVLRMDKLCTRPRDRDRFELQEDVAESGLDWISTDEDFVARVRQEMRKLLLAAQSKSTPLQANVPSPPSSQAAVRRPIGESRPPGTSVGTNHVAKPQPALARDASTTHG